MGRREPGAGEELTISRLLIANRGEIAARVARTAREMGIEAIGVHAESEPDAFHRRSMDRMVSLGPGPTRETYLSTPRVLEAARASGADAVHPGYGFLSENAAFARAVEGAGLVWVGPPPAAIETMGDKLRSRDAMQKAGVPVVPGSPRGLSADAELGAEAKRLGFPILIKASAGGGGKGMSRVERPEDLAAGLAEGRRVAQAAFGDDAVYLERLLEGCRHVEFQVFGDRSGRVVHLFERECSVQRRHQKIVEETPSLALDAALRRAMGEAAVAAARAVGYVGAGTVEFLVDGSGRFYFLEMNTRLQVEHPITEETLGIDLVRAQIDVADGRPLPEAWSDGSLSPRGHAIELRLYAEDPTRFPAALGAPPPLPGARRARRSRRRRRRRRKRRRRRVRPAAGQARRPGGKPRRGDCPRAPGARGVGDPRSRNEPSAARRRLRLGAVSHGPLHDRHRRAHRACGRGRSSRRRLDRRGPRRLRQRRPRAAVRPRRSARPVGRR